MVKVNENKKGKVELSEKEGVRRGAWTPEEDKTLVDFITKNGHGIWRNLPKLAGLQRCGKSCRLRWKNYLRPDIKRGPFTPEEETAIIHFHSMYGNKWSAIASKLPGRTDNDVKNFWNSHLKKRYAKISGGPSTSSPKPVNPKSDSSFTRHMAQWECIRIEAESRLSVKPLLLNPAPETEPSGNHTNHLWNSKVGQSIQNLSGTFMGWSGMASRCHSPASQVSSVVQVEPGSSFMLTAEPCMTTSSALADKQLAFELVNYKMESENRVTPSDSSISYDVDDSPDAIVKMLLDFPASGNDMGFLQKINRDASA